MNIKPIATGLVALTVAVSAFAFTHQKNTPAYHQEGKKFTTTLYQYESTSQLIVDENQRTNWTKVTGAGPDCNTGDVLCTIEAPVPAIDDGHPDFAAAGVSSTNPVRNNDNIIVMGTKH